MGRRSRPITRARGPGETSYAASSLSSRLRNSAFVSTLVGGAKAEVEIKDPPVRLDVEVEFHPPEAGSPRK